jgi:hypothetical protein
MGAVVNVVSFRVPRANHDDVLKLIAGGIDHRTGNDFQRKHPERFFYSRSRTFYRVDEETDTEEWFFMDEYDDIELFHRMTAAWTSDDPAIRDPMADDVVHNNHPKMFSMLAEGSLPQAKLYEVLEPLTLEFEPWSRRAAAWERDTDDWWKLEPLKPAE